VITTAEGWDGISLHSGAEAVQVCCGAVEIERVPVDERGLRTTAMSPMGARNDEVQPGGAMGLVSKVRSYPVEQLVKVEG
jgi:hypothetical protein